MASIKFKQGDEWVKIPNLGVVQGVEEAPADGNQYARKDGSWSMVDKIGLVSGDSGDVTATLNPNTFYEFGECTSLTITLGTAKTGVYNEYMFQFASGATATALTMPDTVKWVNDEAPEIEANRIYQCSIVNNIGVIASIENA